MSSEDKITIADCPPNFDLEKWRRFTRYQRLRVLVFERDGHTCRHCDAYLPPQTKVRWKQKWLQLDHIIPTSKGGLTTLANCQALCNQCNSRKGDRVRPNGPLGWPSLLVAPAVWL